MAFSGTAQFLVDYAEAMAEQPGRWRCTFFDRAPDALFGDDVKTRNAVLIYDAAKPRGIETTSILRWTSRTRAHWLFRSAPLRPLHDARIIRADPKLGSDVEVTTLYRAVRSRPPASSRRTWTEYRRRLSHPGGPANGDSSRRAVYVAPTAYNWLNCARSL